MTDQELDVCIQHLAQDEGCDALRLIYDEMHQPVYLYALSMLKDKYAAEDVAQDVFVQMAVNARRTFRAQGRPRSWVFTIAHNLVLKEFRIQQKSTPVDDDYLTSLSLSSSEQAYQDIEALELLNDLTDEEREIVSLHLFGRLKFTEIAQATNRSYAQIQAKYAYCMRKLRKLLIMQERMKMHEKPTG